MVRARCNGDRNDAKETKLSVIHCVKDKMNRLRKPCEGVTMAYLG